MSRRRFLFTAWITIGLISTAASAAPDGPTRLPPSILEHCPQLVDVRAPVEGALAVRHLSSGLMGKLFGVISAGGGKTVPPISDKLRITLRKELWLPMSTEVEYGKRSHDSRLEDVLQRQGRRPGRLYAAAESILSDISRQIDVPHEYEFKIFVVKSAARNVVAQPGGYLYVDRGLLEKKNLRPIAFFAVAHEVAHLLRRHETRELQSLIVDSFGTREELAKGAMAAEKSPDALLSRLGAPVSGYTQHAAAEEIEVDACTIRLLNGVNFDRSRLAESVAAVLENLRSEGAIPIVNRARDLESALQTAQMPLVARTKSVPPTQVLPVVLVRSPFERHPTTPDRLEALTSLVAELTR